MLHLNVPFGDSLVIDDGKIVVTFVKRTGNNDVRIAVDADRSISINVSPASRHKPWANGLTKNQPPRKSEDGK